MKNNPNPDDCSVKTQPCIADTSLGNAGSKIVYEETKNNQIDDNMMLRLEKKAEVNEKAPNDLNLTENETKVQKAHKPSVSFEETRKKVEKKIRSQIVVRFNFSYLYIYIYIMYINSPYYTKCHLCINEEI